jgi:hypothetical protein
MFLKRTTYDQAYELTESWRGPEERERRAYMKIFGVDAVREGLEKAGYAPR